MALELVQPGIQPLGQFDGYDDIYLTVKGGEVATIKGILVSKGDKAAYDASGADGYVGVPPNQYRPVVTTRLVSGDRPLCLVDDGISGYGTLFGSVLGGVAGQLTTGTVLGPHTATASGKLTLWDKPGTYAVTLDAVDTTPSTGLVPTNTSLLIGSAIYATPAGLLTQGSSTFEGVVLGRFLNFETLHGGTLVNTPVNLAAGNTQTLKLARALITFNPPA